MNNENYEDVNDKEYWETKAATLKKRYQSASLHSASDLQETYLKNAKHTDLYDLKKKSVRRGQDEPQELHVEDPCKHLKVCTTCQGHGQLQKMYGARRMEETCARCNGDGVVPNLPAAGADTAIVPATKEPLAPAATNVSAPAPVQNKAVNSNYPNSYVNDMWDLSHE